MKNSDINYIQADRQSKKTLLFLSQNEFKLDANIEHTIDVFCLQQGTTIKGRVEAIRKVLQIYQKVPIYIHEDLFLFPTTSSKSNDCVWMNYCNIRKLIIVNYYETIIIFKDKSLLSIVLNYRIIKKQMQRCKQYIKFLENQENICFIQNGKVIL